MLASFRLAAFLVCLVIVVRVCVCVQLRFAADGAKVNTGDVEDDEGSIRMSVSDLLFERGINQSINPGVDGPQSMYKSVLMKLILLWR